MSRLVVVGDSLSQGFQSGAVHNTPRSFPVMIANAIGIAEGAFRYPRFGEPNEAMIVNMERLLRDLSDKFGGVLSWWELPLAGATVVRYLDAVEDYWERGRGTEAETSGSLHHNLAVWGFEIGDADTLSDAVCARNTPSPKDQGWLRNQVTEQSMYRTARRTLNPAQKYGLGELTQIDLVERIAKDEGPIENLMVMLGANNVLGTCVQLAVRWSQSADMHKLAHERSCTIWEPDHFAKALDRVHTRVRGLQERKLVKNVFVGTVPHVTIAPVARGVSPAATLMNEPPCIDGYFEYYTRFWIWDKDFISDPSKYPRISRESVRLIDRTIDEYNDAIKARAQKYEWHVIDYGRLLDDLAFRRRSGKPAYRFPDAMVAALEQEPRTKFRVFANGPNGEQRILLDTRYLRIPDDGKVPAEFLEAQKKWVGGLFSLDGVHPTTIGYGVMAHAALEVMKTAGVAGADPSKLDWKRIVKWDTLVTEPPKLLGQLQDTLSFLFSRDPLLESIRAMSGFGSQPISGA